MRISKVLAIMFLSIIWASSGYGIAEECMIVRLSSSKAVSDAIVTLECSIQCDRLMGTNFYLVFDSSRIQLLNTEEVYFDEIKRNTALAYDTNLFNEAGNETDNTIEMVNSCGYVGIAIYDPKMERDTTYFSSEKKILALRFRVMPGYDSDPIQFTFYGKGALATSAVCAAGKLSWNVAAGSGVITLVQTDNEGFVMQMPANVRQIADEAFAGNPLIERVEIQGERLERIGERAFADCSALKAIAIPSSVTSIGDDAFDGCAELIITCTAGSTAERYAIDNRIPYVLQ